MNQEIKDTYSENSRKQELTTTTVKRKEYTTPNMTNIGMINKMTLNGVEEPQADSGANYTS